MNRLAYTIIVGLFIVLDLGAKELSIAEQKAEQIRNSSAYYSGEGFGVTIEEADRDALVKLSQSIKMTISTKTVGSESQTNNDFSQSIYSKTGISSFTTLTNTEQIILNQEPKAQVIRFMKKSELESALSDREKKIKDLIVQGIEQEKNVEIGAALQYFNWALSLSLIHPRNIYTKINGKDENVKIWVKSKISTILNTIKVELADVTTIENDFDKYRVNLKVTYLDREISCLEYSYFNGLKKVENCYIKNGEADLEFPELPRQAINLSYEYKYSETGKNFDEELRSYYENNTPTIFSQADVTIPVKLKGEELTLKQEKKDKKEVAIEQKDALIAPPQVGKQWTQIDKPMLPEGEAFRSKMERVEGAIRSNNYTSVKDCFTDEGYKLFLQMMSSGKIAVASKPEYKIERTGNFIVGRQIPVSIKYNKRYTCRENITFRFNIDGQIESMAYALTNVAQENIFRQSRWSLQARYAIQYFMEDYQTAFALKRLDYIKQIFSDKAIIINGKVTKNASSKRGGYCDASETAIKFPTPTVTYKRFNKEEYLDYLEKDFLKKRFIQLRYEENEIVNANTKNLSGDVYWIELKQFYSSDIYCDQGYLTLMLDMTDTVPQIMIRTWTPQKASLEDMMKRFAIE